MYVFNDLNVNKQFEENRIWKYGMWNFDDYFAIENLNWLSGRLRE